MGTHGIAAAPAASIVPEEESKRTWTPELLDSLFANYVDWLDESVPVLPTIPAQEGLQDVERKTLRFPSACCASSWRPRVSPSERHSDLRKPKQHLTKDGAARGQRRPGLLRPSQSSAKSGTRPRRKGGLFMLVAFSLSVP